MGAHLTDVSCTRFGINLPDFHGLIVFSALDWTMSPFAFLVWVHVALSSTPIISPWDGIRYGWYGIRSVSKIPQPWWPGLLAAWIAFLAILIPWWILLSEPIASWQGDSVWVATSLNLSLVMPVVVLKSEFNNEIFLLSPGFVDFGFLGLQPNTMSEVRCDIVGGCPPWTGCTTSVRASPTVSQQKL